MGSIADTDLGVGGAIAIVTLPAVLGLAIVDELTARRTSPAPLDRAPEG